MSISNLLGWASYDWETWDASYAWLGTVFSPLSTILYVALALVGAAGAIYAIYLGIQLARAEDTSKRDDAKAHLITVLIAIAVTLALVLFFNEVMPAILSGILGSGPTA